MGIIVGLLVWFALLNLYVGFFRNKRVLKERLRLIDLISEKAQKDIHAGRNWAWRYEELNSISYNKMLLKFWIPVKSFFNDAKCIQD